VIRGRKVPEHSSQRIRTTISKEELTLKSIKPLRLVSAVTAIAAIAAVFAGSALGGPSATDTAVKKNLVQTAAGAGDFDTLVSLVGQAGLADTLATGGNFTIFAPTDAAFARVPKSTLDALASDPAQLKSVLLYHVAKGRVPASKVVKKTRIRTLNGAKLRIKVRKSGVRVNNAKVTKVNVRASNGVIHVISRVLLPPKG
jgi:uncharacterized surface protein with fasciclin (FAS1) repeats